MRYKAVVIGASAGGIVALGEVLEKLPSDFPLPILVVQHKPSHGDEKFWIDHFTRKTRIPVRVAQAKRAIKGPGIYISSGGYHFLVEMN
jgi:two-component system, chemotaxis family, protein-glutamate methylesterase/glutaminase